MTELQNKPEASLVRSNTKWRFIPAGLGVVMVGLVALLIFSLWPRDEKNGQPSLAASPNPSGSPATAALSKTSEGGQVTVKATWQGVGSGLTFQVSLDTHSVDLDSYDLARMAVLRTAEGQEVKPNGWEAAKGGHHRSGTLTFPVTAPDGRKLLGPDTRSFELVLKGVGGVPERVLSWSIS
ncbi:MAG TPA: hypothetical protein VH186_36870 [Chloroflexia bacterium]|nr:hypothetical protein [Chloroflexia bacterium]